MKKFKSVLTLTLIVCMCVVVSACSDSASSNNNKSEESSSVAESTTASSTDAKAESSTSAATEINTENIEDNSISNEDTLVRTMSLEELEEIATQFYNVKNEDASDKLIEVFNINVASATPNKLNNHGGASFTLSNGGIMVDGTDIVLNGHSIFDYNDDGIIDCLTVFVHFSSEEVTSKEVADDLMQKFAGIAADLYGETISPTEREAVKNYAYQTASGEFSLYGWYTKDDDKYYNISLTFEEVLN